MKFCSVHYVVIWTRFSKHSLDNEQYGERACMTPEQNTVFKRRVEKDKVKPLLGRSLGHIDKIPHENHIVSIYA